MLKRTRMLTVSVRQKGVARNPHSFLLNRSIIAGRTISAAAAPLSLAAPPPAPPLAVHRRRCAGAPPRLFLPPLLCLRPLLLLCLARQGRPRPAINIARPAGGAKEEWWAREAAHS